MYFGDINKELDEKNRCIFEMIPRPFHLIYICKVFKYEHLNDCRIIFKHSYAYK